MTCGFSYRREQAELERIHGMTDEERRLEMKLKPKVMVNKATKGKYKFLQKYYHRGVFFLVSNPTSSISSHCHCNALYILKVIRKMLSNKNIF